MWSYVQRRHIRRIVRDELLQRTEASEKPGRTTLPLRAPDRNAPSSPKNTISAPPSTHDRSPTDLERQRETNAPPDEKESDVIIVRASGREDPLDPRNWSLVARCKNIFILSLLIFVQGWAGAADSMANAQASREFGVSQVAENLSTAMYLLGVGSGAVFAGPFSETFGRNPTYLGSTFCYLGFVLGSALTPTFGGQLACRYFVGLFASATLSINGASVRDQFYPVKRAWVFPKIAWANVASPVLAPVAGGWIVSNPRLGWRWTEWITLIISSFAFIIALLFLPETYLPLLLDWKAKELRHATGDTRYTSEHAKSKGYFKTLKRNLPLTLVFARTEPAIIVLGSYLVLLYILLFTFQSGFDYIFRETYQLSTGLTGSCFAAVAADPGSNPSIDYGRPP
ncbi:MFS transporter, DHA1 family, multidrug resistance protein [Scedosporium apiospermum]|uniref:MFS transporter, DHA1 family, multidrug resistance protein n=1 Tax=Pseudallescheria apiosperma TaxID=563466 RepID=A0A084GEC6_PSEDA|nr:MFS transporter, DHA1 family, multidrug resistance protein [Scedosporium apiospermum]KEZ45688.1 MFS transporter, DHA1 family, multidrug resistance protein [Scedosporium apiospermum]